MHTCACVYVHVLMYLLMYVYNTASVYRNFWLKKLFSILEKMKILPLSQTYSGFVVIKSFLVEVFCTHTHTHSNIYKLDSMLRFLLYILLSSFL